MIKINLLSREEKKQTAGLNNFIIGALALAAVLLVIIAIHLTQAVRLGEVNDKIAKTQKRIGELEEVKKKVDDFKLKNKELEDKIRVIAVLEENRTGPLFVMDALANAIPERSWFDNFSEKGFVAKVEGIAWDEFTVANFMKGMQASPYFRNVELKSIKAKDVQTLSLRTFVIESRLNYSGKSEPKPEVIEEKKPK
ncbi:MAG: PilN domain-containing protein [Deltaproteobacteria bacterium]